MFLSSKLAVGLAGVIAVSGAISAGSIFDTGQLPDIGEPVVMTNDRDKPRDKALNQPGSSSTTPTGDPKPDPGGGRADERDDPRDQRDDRDDDLDDVDDVYPDPERVDDNDDDDDDGGEVDGSGDD